MTIRNFYEAILDPVNESANLKKLADEFINSLITEYTFGRLRNLTEREVQQFEVCILFLEFEFFHNDKEMDICYILSEVCSSYPSLDSLNRRINFLNLPSKINHVENDWKLAIQKFVSLFPSLQDMSSDTLSSKGKQVFVDRCGIKVISQINSLLCRVNRSSELPLYLANLVLGSPEVAPEITRILGFLTKSNDCIFQRNLIVCAEI